MHLSLIPIIPITELIRQIFAPSVTPKHCPLHPALEQNLPLMRHITFHSYINQRQARLTLWVRSWSRSETILFAYIKLFKPSGFFTFHQVFNIQKFCMMLALRCFVRISEQTATPALYVTDWFSKPWRGVFIARYGLIPSIKQFTFGL